MHPIAYDPFVSPDYARNLGVELVSLKNLLRESDFITLHLPLTEAARGFIGAKELKTCKPTVRLINCARGGLIDETALFKAIENGTIAGAAVDVFAEEPARDNILFGSDKIIVTPHLAASTTEAQASIASDIAEQVLAVFKGQPTRYAVNAPLITPEALTVLAPWMEVASLVGRLASQLIEGQMNALQIKYEGEIASHDTDAIKAAVLGGLLEVVSEERINLVNANIVAQSRGLRVIEQKGAVCENYSSLITAEVTTNLGVTIVAGTLMREQPHMVRVNNYWIDIVPTGNYFLFIDHRDRPGLIGSVGMVTGDADINISSMQVSRLKPRGQALMVLGLDEPLTEEQQQQMLAIPDIYTAKVVKL